jgi:hypothetical protein
MWVLLFVDKLLRLVLEKRKVWDVRSQRLFSAGERIALGSTKTKLIEGYATVSEVKKLTVAEMKQHNDKHLATDFIEKRWNDRPWLYAFVLSEITSNPNPKPYPRSHGSSKVKLEQPSLLQKTHK